MAINVTEIEGMAPANAASPQTMCFEDFLTLAGETHREWVGGKVVTLSPPSEEHQDIAGFLTALLRFFAEEQQLGVVRPAPFLMKTGADLPGREPDILFLANNNLPRLKQNYLEGPADLVVEIVSPESGSRDRGEKFYEYEKGGVPEYWLIDPVRSQAEFYQRNTQGIYQLVLPGADSLYHSKMLPGLSLDVQWLWSRPRPSLLSVLKNWGLV